MKLQKVNEDFIVDLGYDWSLKESGGKIVLYKIGTVTEFEYTTLEEFAKEWRTLKEPLIKDEKIRKAVRAWAEAVGVDELKYVDSGWSRVYFRTKSDEYEHFIDIDFWHEIDGSLEYGQTYTITELCGEEHPELLGDTNDTNTPSPNSVEKNNAKQ